MKQSTLVCVVAAFLGAIFTALAQQSSDSPSAMSANFCLIKMFGTNNCTARCDVKILNDSFKEHTTEGFALLDGKTRQEMDMSQYKAELTPPAVTIAAGMDQQVIVLRPDLKLAYNFYPRLKSYVIRPLPKEDAAARGREPTLEVTELGHENVDGHPCVKKKFTATTGDGEKHEIFAWLASDLKDLPVKTQVADGDNIEVTTYKQIQFVAPDAKLFEPPAGFTRYASFEDLMDATQLKSIADLADTNATYFKFDRLAPMVDFALQHGTNRSIGPVTAKALGLGNERIPAIRINISQEGEPLVHVLTVSVLNSNDLLVARADRVKQTGIVWLTSRTGEIRVTILTSTNGPPKPVPNKEHVNEYSEEIDTWMEFISSPPSEETNAPPPWEDAPHPLNVAAKFGVVSDVEKVLNRDPGAINAQDDEGMTPLACAAVQEQPDVVRFLLEKGADPNIPNKNGLTPLEHACGRDKTNAIVLAKLLLAGGAQINPTNKTEYRITPLDWAVTSDNTELVKLLLDHEANAIATSNSVDGALFTAADRGDTEIAALLIAHGWDVNATNTDGSTPLHSAAWSGRDEVIKLLLSRGAAVDPKEDHGMTPLISAADRENNSTVEILLASGANINATMDDGSTALHRAVARGNKQVVETLLTHGADINIKNKDGVTPLEFADKCHQPAMAELLRQHGAKE